MNVCILYEWTLMEHTTKTNIFVILFTFLFGQITKNSIDC